MEKLVYITEEEWAKCQKVADAFAELYKMENIVVLDAGIDTFRFIRTVCPCDHTPVYCSVHVATLARRGLLHIFAMLKSHLDTKDPFWQENIVN